MRKFKYLIVLSLSWVMVQGQNPQTITLDYCYQKLNETYPVAKKLELQQKITETNIRLKQTGMYPEFALSGNVSYQSEVVDVPFPGSGFPEFSKDHYLVSLDLSQPVFDAGRTGALKKLEENSGMAATAGYEADLWKIRSQAEQVYFGILLRRKQLETVDLLLKDLNEQLALVEVRVENGVLLPSNAMVLKAEIIKVEQQRTEIQSGVESGYAVLGELIGEDLSSNQDLELPGEVEPDVNGEIQRPEYDAFDARHNLLDSQIELTGADKLPVVSAYAKTAYGRPGFDAFNDDLHFFWIVGLRANWSFRSWRNSDHKEQVIRLQQEQLAADKDSFTRQLNASLRQTEANISSLRQQIALDEEVLKLREAVVEEKRTQLNEGVITSTEFLTELNAEARARLNLELHKIQLVQSNYEYLTKQGKSWN